MQKLTTNINFSCLRLCESTKQAIIQRAIKERRKLHEMARIILDEAAEKWMEKKRFDKN